MEDRLTETFGERVKRLRKARRLSQGDLGDLAGGVSHSAIGQWERMLARPEMDNLVWLAESLHTTIDMLVWGDEVASGIEARLRKIPKMLRDGLVMKLHREIDDAEKLAKLLHATDAVVKDTDARLREWSAKNKLAEDTKRARKRARPAKGARQ